MGLCSNGCRPRRNSDFTLEMAAVDRALLRKVTSLSGSTTVSGENRGNRFIPRAREDRP